ncbi:MAG: YscO family type III secretion system apparatus protein [Geminicoccaceae bacterium]|nr:YscO family type III secretion system apparatus protein [Geminicoccaceae bacterium]
MQSSLDPLLQLRHHRERRAQQDLAACHRNLNDCRNDLGAALAECEQHRLDRLDYETRFRKEVEGRKVKTLTIELFQLQLDSMQVKGELLASRVEDLKNRVASASAALAEARNAWQSRRRDTERLDHLVGLARREQGRAHRRREESVLDDLSPSLPSFAAGGRQ